jgi:hypothetical protein
MPSTTLIRSLGYCGGFGCIIAGIVVSWACSAAAM